MVMLSACGGKDDPIINPDKPIAEEHAICFSSSKEEGEELVTRARETSSRTRVSADVDNTRANTPLNRDFVVYGYKQVGGATQLVIDGYTVQYLSGSANTSADNTHDYFYVGGEQTLKYWDFAASEYHFWGMYEKTTGLATFSGSNNETLTIHGVQLKTGEPDPADDVLFSAVNVRQPVSPDVVRLLFKRPYAKLRVLFYTSETIEDDSDNIELTKLSFAPDPSATTPLVNQVYGKGDVEVTYPLPNDNCSGDAKESIVVQNLSSPSDYLSFKDVTLTQTAGISSNTAVTAKVDDSEGEYYYPLPMGELNPAFTMKVCINGDDELKTAVVPAVYMRWQANYLYTYIFKITEAGKKIEFYDVKIDPWKYGGSQEEEWRNW